MELDEENLAFYVKLPNKNIKIIGDKSFSFRSFLLNEKGLSFVIFFKLTTFIIGLELIKIL